ncbi:MAG: hypothetical protein M3N13_08555 [Candidatus Eremiobacteraeota bacterium]|nr:hypothetical protein [Candidatus Eremiobacteraeota bacterium]
MSEETKPGDLYDSAVGDGTKTPKADGSNEEPCVVESNASNYGASALPIEREPSEEDAPSSL